MGCSNSTAFALTQRCIRIAPTFATALNDAILYPVAHRPLKIDGSSKDFPPEERRQRWPLWMKEGCGTTFLLALHCQHLPSCYLVHMLFSGTRFHRRVNRSRLRCPGWDSPHLHSRVYLKHLPHAVYLSRRSSINATKQHRPYRAHMGGRWTQNPALERGIIQGCKLQL